MKKIVIAFYILFLSFIFPTHIWADSTTSQTSGSGQVQLNANGDVIYLTTQTNPESTKTAQAKTALPDQEIKLPTGFAQNFSQFLNSVLSLVMIVSALLVFLVLILSAFQWITSGGDKGKTDAARNRMTAAIVGIIIVSASYAVLTLVLKFLGFADINAVFESLKTIN